MMEIGYNKAIEVLKNASFEHGFVASVQNETNYKRVWTRDSVVCGLAALKTEDEALVQTFKNAIETIFSKQHPAGFFPSNVNVQDQTVSYGGAVGRTDNVTWAIIGLCSLSLAYPSIIDFESYLPKVRKGFEALDVWEFNGKHLLYMPQSGNWADEYCQHGYLLSEQLLRIWALELASKLYQAQEYLEKAQTIRRVVENNFHLIESEKDVYLPLIERSRHQFPYNFWLAGFNPSTIYTNFDLLANTLALKLGLGNQEQQNRLVLEFKNRIEKVQFLLPSFDPVIEPKMADFYGLKEIYSYSFRNYPGHFHNGGIWPVWNGLLAQVLKEYDLITAKKLEGYLQEACKMGISQEWEFNECLNGITHLPNGVPKCSWSAAGLIISK
jgi:hypothetical protein